jgi:hypothetical protein
VLPHFLFPPHRRTQIYSDLCPLAFAARPVARQSLSLSPHSHYLTWCVVHLPICGILERVVILWLIAASPKTLHKITSAVKR